MTALLEHNDYKKIHHQFRVPACPLFIQNIELSKHFSSFDISD